MLGRKNCCHSCCKDKHYVVMHPGLMGRFDSAAFLVNSAWSSPQNGQHMAPSTQREKCGALCEMGWEVREDGAGIVLAAKSP